MNNCKIIAITNQKGGVGKTATAVSLGAALAAKGKRVLLVDADPQGSLTVSLGIKSPDQLSVSLASLMQTYIDEIDGYVTRDDVLCHVYKNQGEGLDIIPSNIELSGMEISLFNVMSRETVLKSCLEPIVNGDKGIDYGPGFKPLYDYILIDCMPSLSLMTINALAAADSVIIPTQPNYLSAKGINLLLKSIAKVKRSINPSLEIDGLLFTMVDERTNNARDIIAELNLTLSKHIRIFETKIPKSVRVAESALNGVSILKHDSNGKVATAYRELANEIIGLKEKNRFLLTKNNSREEQEER